MASRSATFPDGLANRSGQVGKNLMFHPFAAVGGIFPQALDSWAGPIGSVIFSHEFYETDPRRKGYVAALREADADFMELIDRMIARTDSRPAEVGA